MIRRIVIATDGSLVARHAVSVALDVAQSLKDVPDLHAVAVVNYVTAPAGLSKAPPGAPDLLGEEADLALQEAAEAASARGLSLQTHVLSGEVSDRILEFARENGADLIVAGTHGRRGLARTLLGSACEQLLRSSEIPVLTVRDPALAEAARKSAKSSRTP